MPKEKRRGGSRIILDRKTFLRIKSMDFMDMNNWVVSMYNSGYQDAIDETVDIPPESIIEEVAKLRGIGPKRKEAIFEVLKRIEQEARKGKKHEQMDWNGAAHPGPGNQVQSERQ